MGQNPTEKMPSNNTAVNEKAVERKSFHRSEYFINRELSWLEFNQRVLEEALDPSNPLLERLKFIAIVSSNLDEFFMVRVAGVQDQIEAGFRKRDSSGLTPEAQMKKIFDPVADTRFHFQAHGGSPLALVQFLFNRFQEVFGAFFIDG